MKKGSMMQSAGYFVLAGAMILAGLQTVQAEESIAVIDVAKVMQSTDLSKKTMAKVKKMQESARDKMQDMENKIRAEQSALEQRRTTLSDDQFLSEQAGLRKKIREFRLEEQTLTEEIQGEILTNQNEIKDALSSVVDAVSKERGYKLVLAKSLILHSAAESDITDEVLRRVNEKLK